MHCVITTINKPTKAVEKWHKIFGENLIIVGDKKTPEWEYKGITPIQSTKLYAPENHYARKNAGYMKAIENKAKLIYDTDDDNIPKQNWAVRKPDIESYAPMYKGWFNVYKLLLVDREIFRVEPPEAIWPRGFSLRHLKNPATAFGTDEYVSPIQQGLADGDPDVDAIWRIVFSKKVFFGKDMSVFLTPGTWCPFNSQSTWWFPKAYPLLYLPVYASFRMTDIWRSFVAQRCLWELGEGVTFHSPSEVFQDRNEHDLMKDFEQEIPGYLNNDRIVEILGGLKLSGSVIENLLSCYEVLIENSILPILEWDSLKEWVKDLEYVNTTGNIS